MILSLSDLRFKQTQALRVNLTLNIPNVGSFQQGFFKHLLNFKMQYMPLFIPISPHYRVIRTAGFSLNVKVEKYVSLKGDPGIIIAIIYTVLNDTITKTDII